MRGFEWQEPFMEGREEIEDNERSGRSSNEKQKKS
jgi:hypothetical protein